MASSLIVKRKTGPDGVKVLWREDNVQRSMTFDDPLQAALLERCLNANGNRLAPAEAMAANELAAGPELADSIEQHIKGLTGVEERTRADYRREARLHIIPALGHLRTGSITRRDIKAWVNASDEAGASAKSIGNRHSILSAVMASAIEDGLRPDNPCKGVRMPERDRRDDHEVFLEPEEYERLLTFIPQHWQLLVEVLAGTGARWGEATALQVKDLVQDAPVPFIRIRQAWKKDAKGRPYLSRPKTRRSLREVTISTQLRDRLLPLLEHRDGPDSYLLQSASGRPVSYNYFHEKIWSPAVRRALAAGAVRVRPKIHSLRHSHGSWLIADGISEMAVQRRLGHNSITTTTNIYGHISARTEKAAAEAIGRVLG